MLDIGAGPGRHRPGAGRARAARVDGGRSVRARRPARLRTSRCIVQDLDDEPDVRRRRLRLPAAARRHRAPEGARSGSSSGCARSSTTRRKTLVLTTPNIAFVVQRLMLLLGQFNYGKAGILDRTHTRLFTFRIAAPAAARRRLPHQGDARRAGAVPEGARRRAARPARRSASTSCSSASARRSSRTRSSSRPRATPDVDFVLQDATRRSARGSPQRGRATTSIAPGRVMPDA